MNCTLTRATSTELDAWGVHANLPPATFSEHTNYATAPMAAILPLYQPPSEEELHTSFEQAISKRTSALHERLSRTSYPVPQIHHVRNVDPIIHTNVTHNDPVIRQQRSTLLPSSGWRRSVVLIGMALIFTMIGFDLMGLLILHMH